MMQIFGLVNGWIGSIFRLEEPLTGTVRSTSSGRRMRSDNMGRHDMRILILFGLFPVSIVAAGDILPSCKFERSAKVHFSGPQSLDTLRVSVIGSPCWEGMASISITSSTGDVLYRRDQRFKPLNSAQWDDPGQPDLARQFVDETIETGLREDSSQLPPWEGDGNAFYETNSTTLTIDPERYEALRKMKLPVFYHKTYYEGGIHLVYDPTQRAATIVLEGGL